MRFPWRKKSSEDAQKALEEAREKLDEVKQRDEEVNEVSASLRDIGERNHFADQMEEIIVHFARRKIV